MSRHCKDHFVAATTRWLTLAAALGVAAAPAAAHFLWIAIEPGDSRSVRLSFGETPEEGTQAVPVSRLALARVLDAAGNPLVLLPGDDAWTGSLADHPAPVSAVTAVESWGVVDRSGDGSGAFLLEYYAKAAADLQAATTDLGLPLEIRARQDGTRVTLSVRQAGRGVALAPVHLHAPDGRTIELTADDQGEVAFDAERSGLYGVRSRWIEDRRGEIDGLAFGEVRHYATLTFSVGLPAAGEQPVNALPASAAGAARDDVRAVADPEAYALLESAHDARQVMPAGYPGFACDLVYEQGDEVAEGRLVYRREGETEVTLDGLDEASLEWVHDQVLNLVGHRRGGDFAAGDGRLPLELGPDDGNPYGRLIVLHDDLQSSYRVKDQRVLEVTRTMGDSRFTISVIETMDADPGRYLANHFVVSYRDRDTGVLEKIEGYRDRYEHVEGVWLPAARTILEVTADASPVVRTLRLRKPVHLPVHANVSPDGDS